MRKSVCAWFLALLPVPGMAQVYADFQTSLGNFSCRLDHAATPRTVANFVTLAEGSRPWLDERSGSVSSTRPAQPFYNGLTFHRVVDQDDLRIIQSGSPKDDGTDGPGYTFPDETSRSSTEPYDRVEPYLLSMATAGLNTNGSQFFITGAVSPSLDGKHTVFGKVVSGQEVIEEILGTGNSLDDRPLHPAVIRSVSIRREGLEALKFDAAAIELPTVSAPRFLTRFDAEKGTTLIFPQPPRSLLRVWISQDDGNTWEDGGRRYIGPGEKPLSEVQISDSTSRSLQYRPVLTTYPEDAITPGSVANHQLYLENESGDYLFRLGAPGDRSYLIVKPSGETKSGPIQQFSYEADGYGATVVIDLGDEGSFRYRLVPKTHANGVITGAQGGSFYNELFGWLPYSGNTDFSLSRLPR